MIKSFNQIHILQERLQARETGLLKENKIFKYKITKQLNQQTTLHVLSVDQIAESFYNDVNDKDGYPPIDIRYIDKEEYNEDKEYWDNFFDTKNSFEGTTRRLENAFGKYPSKKEASLPPVVSFYSYKGGVGRSTTLAAFASYHARRTGAKVLIIDCDFEAPGFSNFYGMDEQDLSAKSGVVEYLVDSSYVANRNVLNVSDYVHTISASASKDPIGYAGDKGGEIYVMKAGNLSVEFIEGSENAPNGLRTHQDHYLQGLARIDFANSDAILEQFTGMLKHICSHQDYKPDLVLIDSRTGFNDIFNNIALRLSDIVLGFFGTSKQNIPGIYEFLDTIKVMSDDSPEILLINSLCSGLSESYKEFKEVIAEYDLKTGNEMRNLPMWSIGYEQNLSKIGTSRDKGDDLLIYTDADRYRFPDYQNGSKGDTLLEYLSKQIVQKKNDSEVEPLNNVNQVTNFNIQSVTKDEILGPLLDFFENENYSHAEGKVSMAKDEFLSKYFYFRNFLSDIFKRDIFIVRGYKGTGKTLIYNALQNVRFTEKLMSVYNINNDFKFLNIVDYNPHPQLGSNNYSHLNLGLPQATYYKRFWVIYVWNEIIKRANINYISSLLPISITNEEDTRRNIEKLMQDDVFFRIEKDLQEIDTILKGKNTKLIISFDYLDDIIPLDTWGSPNNAMAELMNWCKMLPYSNIYPKIFIRTELYGKLRGIVNIKALENKILSLEWNSEELFAYFFKIVYAKTKDKFISWLRKQNSTNMAPYILEIRELFEANNGQISLENKDIIEFLVNNFFGETIDIRKPNHGKTYSWFYNNLESANDIISLRPFIALLKQAIIDARRVYGFMVDLKQPILSGQFFASDTARVYAAQQHFEDIVGEKDNDLIMFVDAMRSQNPILNKYRKMLLVEDELRFLIIDIYELNGIRDVRVRSEQWKKMRDKLVDAGIIRHNSSFRTTYSFAFLYKFYLRLEGNPARNK